MNKKLTAIKILIKMLKILISKKLNHLIYHQPKTLIIQIFLKIRNNYYKRIQK